jgi:hypothetical protein
MTAARRAFVAVALGAVLLGALAVPSAAVAWTAPFAASPGYSNLGDLAMDGAGRTTIVWYTEGSSMDGRLLRADGSFGPTQVLGLGSAQVGADDHGNSYLVGNGPSGVNERRIYYRRISASGALGPALPLSPPGADAVDPALAVDPAGDVVAAWDVRNPDPEPRYRVQIRAVSRSGDRSAIQTMPGYGAIPHVAMDPGGDATVFWWKKNGFDAVQRDGSAGVFGAPIQVSATGFGTHQVLMDASGGTTFLYKPASLSHASDAYLIARRLSSAGDLGAPLRVGKAGRGAVASAMDGSGNVLIVWAPYTDGPHAVRDRVLSAGGALGPPQAISTGPALAPDVAVNPVGDAVIGWGEPNRPGQSVDVIERSADGTLGSRQQLAGSNLYNGAPAVGIADDGRAIAAWTRWSDPLTVRLSTDP